MKECDTQMKTRARLLSNSYNIIIIFFKNFDRTFVKYRIIKMSFSNYSRHLKKYIELVRCTNRSFSLIFRKYCVNRRSRVSKLIMYTLNIIITIIIIIASLLVHIFLCYLLFYFMYIYAKKR